MFSTAAAAGGGAASQSSIEGASSPVQEQTRTADEEAAVMRLQRIGRAFLERNGCFFKSNLKQTLSAHAELIPATPQGIAAACDHVWEKRTPITKPPAGVPYVNCRIGDAEPIDLLIPLRQMTIEKGSFSKVIPSLFVQCAPWNRVFSVSQKALKLVRHLSHLPEEARKRARAQAAREIQLLTELHAILKEKGISGACLADPYEPITPEKSYLQKWYPADLEKAMKERSVRLDLSSAASSRSFRLADALGCLRRVAVTLRILNSLGYVHRDVKPQNMLISFEDGGFVGRLADFGFMIKGFGPDPLSIQNPYECWGPLEVGNISTPLGDRYGLTMTLILLLSSTTSCTYLANIRDEIICTMIKDLRANLVPNADAPPLEREFRLICYQSMLVFFAILENTRVDIPRTFARGRTEEANRNISDSQLSIALLQHLTKEHQNLFTHERIVAAMESTAQRMASQGHPTCTMEDLIEIIDRAHLEESIGTMYSRDFGCLIC